MTTALEADIKESDRTQSLQVRIAAAPENNFEIAVRVFGCRVGLASAAQDTEGPEPAGAGHEKAPVAEVST